MVRRLLEGASTPEVKVGELSLVAWLDLFWSCHNVQEGAVVQWCWPNEGTLLEQPALTVTMFKVMRGCAQGWINDEMEAATRKNG